MSTPFKGVLAVIGRTTRDGRRLAPHDPALGPLTRAMPVPIVHRRGFPVGRIDTVWIDGNLVRYSGQIVEDLADQIREKVFVPGMDVDRADVQPGSGDDLVLVGWRVVGATMDPYEHRAWPEVQMELMEGE